MINNQWEKFTLELKQLYGKNEIPLHEPTFKGNELEYVSNCVTSGWVSSVGAYVNSFETQLAEFTGAKYAVLVVNGTAALQIALKAAGVQPGDEVFIPSLSFVATANAVHYLGATPHFTDVSDITLGIDPQKLEQYIIENTVFNNGLLVNKHTDNVIRAVVPMHTFGHPVELDALLKICEKYNLVMVEDAAESIGSYYKGKHTGNFGKVSAVSFNGNKIITTGGGGAILTNDEGIAKYVKHITTTAKVPHRWEYEHDEIGYNYRMPNLNAALGLAQLEKLPQFIEQKRRLTDEYKKLVSEIDGVTLFTEPAHCESNYWLQTLVLDEDIDRYEILSYLNDNGIMSRPIWKPLHLLSMYNSCPRMNMDVTEKLNARIINVPSTPIEGLK